MLSSIQLLASSFSPGNINLWSRLFCIGITAQRRVSGQHYLRSETDNRVLCSNGPIMFTSRP